MKKSLLTLIIFVFVTFVFGQSKLSEEKIQKGEIYKGVESLLMQYFKSEDAYISFKVDGKKIPLLDPYKIKGVPMNSFSIRGVESFSENEFIFEIDQQVTAKDLIKDATGNKHKSMLITSSISNSVV
jgi:hypothetical protein